MKARSVRTDQAQSHLKLFETAPREGWEDAFRIMAKRGDDVLLEEPLPTSFDENEWE
jgi:hypothetical protein